MNILNLGKKTKQNRLLLLFLHSFSLIKLRETCFVSCSFTAELSILKTRSTFGCCANMFSHVVVPVSCVTINVTFQQRQPSAKTNESLIAPSLKHLQKPVAAVQYPRPPPGGDTELTFAALKSLGKTLLDCYSPGIFMVKNVNYSFPTVIKYA